VRSKGDDFLAQLEYPLDAKRRAAIVLQLPAQAIRHRARRIEKLVEGARGGSGPGMTVKTAIPGRPQYPSSPDRRCQARAGSPGS
jgi:hypothetical protein